MELSKLEGMHIWSGIEVGYNKDDDGQYVKFTLDGVTYLAIEDPDDGYRSFMQELQIVSEPCKVSLPNINVMCHYSEKSDSDILEFYECTTKNLIMRIGTDELDDYYPYCVMEYYPEKLSINLRKEHPSL